MRISDWSSDVCSSDLKDSEREGRSMRTDLRRLLGAGMGAGLALAVGLGAAGAAQAEVESKDPIKLTLHDWTGQLITTKIMGSVLQKAGYNVEYVQADYIAQFAGLKTGDLHVAMEMWEIGR